MIVIKTGEALDATQALTQLLAVKLPAKAAYHLARIIRTMNVDLKDFHDARNQLIERLGAQVSPGKFQVTDENMPEFERQVAEMIEVEIRVDLEPLHVADLGENCQIEPGILLHCGPVIVE